MTSNHIRETEWVRNILARVVRGPIETPYDSWGGKANRFAGRIDMPQEPAPVRWKSCANKEVRLLLQPSCRMSSSAGAASGGPLGRKFSPTFQCSRNDMEWEWSWWRFLFGALAPPLPEVLRLSKIIVRWTTERRLPHFGPQYFAISVMFIGLGDARRGLGRKQPAQMSVGWRVFTRHYIQHCFSNPFPIAGSARSCSPFRRW